LDDRSGIICVKIRELIISISSLVYVNYEDSREPMKKRLTTYYGYGIMKMIDTLDDNILDKFSS